ncbi:MAG TPA: HlyD family efflux transporter periplasmic adaptor subunit [Caulobacteraceae bacterium]|nr:HlyD family efflux transporter periplasmic adaptor subunit [Caulobacteraceae bacterium]
MIAVAALAAAVAVAWVLLKPHGRPRAASFTGYVVSQDVYMASPVNGTLLSVAVRRGDRVAPGQPLFRVDPTVRAADAARAGAQVEANRAQVDEQRSALARARADLAAAEADAERTGVEARRLAAAQHEKPGAVAQLQLDQAQAAWRSALEKRNAANSQIQAAAAAIAAAEAGVTEARAGVTSAQRQLADLAPVAPAAGRVGDVMYKPGESVSANVPVVSIVPDGEVKVRFYVPETLVDGYRPGRRVAIGCDGCPSGMTATVDFVAPRPEYTPPVIYSLDARQKLVFMVEAVPSDPRALVPGQPMDVAPSAAGSRRR